MQSTQNAGIATRLCIVSLALTCLVSIDLVCARVGMAAATAPPSSAVTAAAPQPNTEVTRTIKQNIESRFPGIEVLDVQPTPIPGIYEVYTGDRIVYADDSADYVLMGPLVDTQTRSNLTEARMNARGTVNFRSLPLERAIKIVKGDGSRQFAVFSDPDCPFCQQLEKSLLPVTNVTMYVFLFPIAGLHPQAPAKAHAIWCAKDRAAAWGQWMHEKKLPAAGASACTGDPIEALQKLGEQLHVNSTPTMVFADGRRVSGAIPTSEIEKLLTASVKPAGAAAAAH